MTEEESKTAQPSDTPPWAWIKCVRDVTDPQKNRRFDSNVPLPVELSPWLLLSDLKSAMNLAKLKENKVTHILSVHHDFPQAEGNFQDILRGTGIIRKHIQCEDAEGYDMIGNHWNECLEFLREVKANNGRVVVHCMAGINRSGLIACAALMVLERKPLLEAVRHCVECRQTVLWNRSFQRQLCELAQHEGLLGPKPDGYDDTPPFEPPLPPPPAHALLRLLEE